MHNRRLLWVAFAILVLSVYTLGAQWVLLGQTNADRMAYLEDGRQMEYHTLFMEARTIDPWQYRVLAPSLIEGLMRLTEGLPRHVALSFMSVRLLQNLLIFGLGYVYLQGFGLRPYTCLVGLSVGAHTLILAAYEQNLTPDTYFDVVFYLAAAVLLMQGRYSWVLGVVVLAAFNRETSGLIPLMMAAAVLVDEDVPRPKGYLLPLAGLLLYALIFVGLRVYFGPRETDTPTPGMEALLENLTYPRAPIWLLATFGLWPFLALAAWPRSPAFLRALFVVIVPFWVGVHLLGSLVVETRLFLVPFWVVVWPMVLYGLEAPRASAPSLAAS